MMTNDLQNPIITRTEKYGYVNDPKVAHQCTVCDEPIYEGESAYYFDGFGWVCEHCADMAYTIAEL